MAIPGCLSTCVCCSPCACSCCEFCWELDGELCAFESFVVDRETKDPLLCLSMLLTPGKSTGRFIKVTLFPTLLASRVGMGV